METESQDHQLDLQDCSCVFDESLIEMKQDSHESIADLINEVDLTNVHPMMQRQVHGLIPLIDNASFLQKRLAALHHQEECMHESLQKDFEEFISTVKKKTTADDIRGTKTDKNSEIT